MTFARLNAGDWVAWVAAIVLVVSLAVDWYGSAQGDEARRIERTVEPGVGGLAGEEARQAREDARHVAEAEERNGLDPRGLVDVLILLLLLASAALAFAAGLMRAAGCRLEPPRTPSAAAAWAGAILALLIAYRIVQEPGLDEATTVKAGALLALLASGALALGARRAYAAEQDGSAWREPAVAAGPADGAPAGPADPADPPVPDPAPGPEART
jgi:hypothetical protein